MNNELTQEMQILEAYEPTTKFQDIAWAKYELCLRFPDASASVAQQLQSLYTTSPLLMTKKSKSGDREIDICTMIKKINTVYNAEHPGEIRISTILSAGNTEHLNPELLIKAAKDQLGILCKDPANESYTILRTHVYTADGVTEFR